MGARDLHPAVQQQAPSLWSFVSGMNGIAGQVAFGPAPIVVFDDQAAIGGQDKMTRFAWEDLDSALLQQGR